MPRSLNDHQFKRLETWIPQMDAKSAPLMALLMYTGIRVGELIRLKWKDFIWIDTTIVEVHIRPRQLKPMAPRNVPIPPKARQSLFAWYCMEVAIHQETINQAIVFPSSKKTGPLTVQGVEYIVRKLGQSILACRLTPHMLRHTYATRVLQHSDIRVVQMLLGHRKLSSTQVYTHPSTEALSLSVTKAFQ